MKIDDPAFEALFRQAVIDEYKEDIDSLPSNEELKKLYPVSAKFDFKMRKIIARYRRKGIYKNIIKHTQKVAVVFLIISTVLFGMLMTNPEVRAAVGNVIVEWFETFTSITFSRQEETKTEQNKLHPEYLPDGFTITSSLELLDLTRIIFSNESDNEIRFMYSANDILTNISIDNEHHIIEDFIINSSAAFIATATDADFDNGIVFIYENYVVEVWGKISVEELIKIAETISVLKN